MTIHAPAEAFASALGALLYPAEKTPSAIASQTPRTPTALVVAYSGGRDSTVLLHLAFAYAQAHQLRLRAIHVNHQLQTAADDFVRHCQRECHALNIPLEICTVAVTRSGKGLEADARDARYHAFAERLHADELLLLGQHADDQLETLLLQLLRGAGPMGLAGMPVTAVCGAARLCRPLLSLRREQLTQLAEHRGWRWIDDPSNADQRFARNRLRHELMPMLLAQREGAAEVLLRAMQWQAEAVALQADLAAIDAAAVAYPNGLLSRQRLLQLSAYRQTNLLRWWLAQQQLPAPNADRLHSFLQQLTSGSDQVFLSWAAQQLRVAADQLVLLPDWNAAALLPQVWRLPGALPLPIGLGVLQLLPEADVMHLPDATASARAPLMVLSTTGLRLRAPRADETVSVRWQTPGLRVTLPGRQGRRELKDIFQEHGVPAWLRPFWPKLFYNDVLVAVPGVQLCQAGVAEAAAPALVLQAEGPLFSVLRRLQTRTE